LTNIKNYISITKSRINCD